MKEQARWLSEMWGKVAEGEELVYMDNRPFSSGPGLDSDPDDWSTRKPTPKVVDLSPLVNSGVLCEFFNEDKSYGGLSFLVEIDEDGCYVNQRTGSYTSCRPLLNHWNVIEGDKPPLITGAKQEFEYFPEGILVIKYTGLLEGWSWP